MKSMNSLQMLTCLMESDEATITISEIQEFGHPRSMTIELIFGILKDGEDNKFKYLGDMTPWEQGIIQQLPCDYLEAYSGSSLVRYTKSQERRWLPCVNAPGERSIAVRYRIAADVVFTRMTGLDTVLPKPCSEDDYIAVDVAVVDGTWMTDDLELPVQLVICPSSQFLAGVVVKDSNTEDQEKYYAATWLGELGEVDL